MIFNSRNNCAFLFLILGALMFSACSQVSKTTATKVPQDREMRKYENVGKLFGDDSLIFGGGHSSADTASSSIIGTRINPYLWKATLSTLHFMPMASTDANGGVIITEWYTSAKKPAERIKITIEITGKELRVNSLKVIVHKQNLVKGQWVNQNAKDTNTETELENIILNTARKLRIHDKK